MLRVEGLHAGHGALTVLRDVDLHVEPGEVLLVLGPNGVGKTTLLRTIAGFLRPKRGTITLGGEDITGRDAAQNARRGLRLVLEEHRVFPDLSVADNLRQTRAIGGHGRDSTSHCFQGSQAEPFVQGRGRVERRTPIEREFVIVADPPR